jgi:hypothetical protein
MKSRGLGFFVTGNGSQTTAGYELWPLVKDVLQLWGVRETQIGEGYFRSRLGVRLILAKPK